MTRLARVFCLAVLILCFTAPGSQAAVSFEPCFEGSDVECGNLAVPIDRSGSVPGTISLRVTRYKAAKPSATPRAVFAFAGGPGQGATPFATQFGAQLARTHRTRDVIVFDQRGTGESGAIDCTDVDRQPDTKNAVAQIRACADKLGPAAPFYTTADTVLDIEALRADLGYQQIGLLGVSYGTKVELAYAAAFPQRVERMVLDSVVQAEGPDPLLRDSFRAVPRILRDLCRSGFCRGITTDPVADMAGAVARMAGGPVTGNAYDVDGKRSQISVDRSLVFTLLVIGDFEPGLRSVMPSAVRSASQGDFAPLLRLAKLLEPPPKPQPPELIEFSTGLWLATVCAELPFPWDADTPEGDRLALAATRSAALDPAQFNPFDQGTAIGWDMIEMCEHWPVSRRPAPLDLSTVQAPVLLANGRADLRTPLENAQLTAARLPNATVLPIPETGHSVAGSDVTGCADESIDNFLAGRQLEPCDRKPPRLKLRSLAPTDMDKLKAAKGTSGNRGRTAKAVDLTIHDVLDELDLFYSDRGGLRGGRFNITDRGIEFKAYVYIPGVKVSGTLDSSTFRGRLRVSGSQAADGKLTVGRKGVVTGMLDGRNVRFRIKLPAPPDGLGDGEQEGEPRVPTWLAPLLGR